MHPRKLLFTLSLFITTITASESQLDPTTAAFLDGFAKMFHSVSALPIPKQREAFAKGQSAKISDLEPVAKVEDKLIPARSSSIPVRIYTPEGKGPLPIIVYYHGGGWVFGSIQASDAFCRRLANTTGAIVASVEYRLAPEHKFPLPLNDCYDATQWIAKNARSFQGNSKKIIVCGDSAGGNLAASVALMNQKEKAFRIAGQLLLYPVLTTELDKQAYDSSLDKALITLENMQFFIDAYLSSPEDRNHPYAAPLKSKDLSHLPPCFVITAEHDALKHEGARYQEALQAAGNKAQHKCYPGAIHGFLSFPLIEETRTEAMDDIKAWLQGL